MSEPDLIPVHAHRALIYIERLELVGVRPTAAQVEALALNDGPSPARYQSMPAAIMRMSAGLSGLQAKVADAEPVAGYLVRLGWVASSGTALTGTLELTSLGRALLVALRTEAPGKFSERDHAVATVLDPDNPIVYLELTRAVAQAGAGMLVDPYFKADMLEWLLNATPITRLLVHAGKGEVTKLEIALDSLASLPGGGRLEVRASASKAFHDRCLVHADHTVRLLGTSVTGVGHHLSEQSSRPVDE